jgi:hypothetical protein
MIETPYQWVIWGDQLAEESRLCEGNSRNLGIVGQVVSPAHRLIFDERAVLLK